VCVRTCVRARSCTRVSVGPGCLCVFARVDRRVLRRC
jgi:hypothetical protein